MTRIGLPYLLRQRDRQGRWIWYYRRAKGRPKARLQGSPGDPEFLASYQAAQGADARPRAPRADWRGLCEAYLASAEFGELARATRRQRMLVLEHTWAEPIAPGASMKMGDVPLDQFSSKAVRVLRDRKRDHPGAANHRLKAISAVFRWAIEAEHVTGNPAREVATLRPRSHEGFHVWTTAEVEQYRCRHQVGSKARLALELLLFTGARRSDVVRLGRPMVAEQMLRWMVAKTRQPIEIPILPELQAVLAATTLTGRDTWLVTNYGRPFTVAGFGNWFRDQCDAAGLPHCTAHGLRKAGATMAAENGATLHQLMAIFGWASAKQALVYTRRADAKRLARDAMKLLAGKS